MLNFLFYFFPSLLLFYSNGSLSEYMYTIFFFLPQIAGKQASKHDACQAIMAWVSFGKLVSPDLSRAHFSFFLSFLSLVLWDNRNKPTTLLPWPPNQPQLRPVTKLDLNSKSILVLTQHQTDRADWPDIITKIFFSFFLSFCSAVVKAIRSSETYTTFGENFRRRIRGIRETRLHPRDPSSMRIERGVKTTSTPLKYSTSSLINILFPCLLEARWPNGTFRNSINP